MGHFGALGVIRQLERAVPKVGDSFGECYRLWLLKNSISRAFIIGKKDARMPSKSGYI